MSYPTKYRERAIEYRQEGHTLQEVSRVFKVSISTFCLWEKQLKEKGHLEKKPVEQPFKKLDPEKLKRYVKEHPDSYQKEIAEVFFCSDTAVRKAFKRLGITRKKRQSVIKKKIQ